MSPDSQSCESLEEVLSGGVGTVFSMEGQHLSAPCSKLVVQSLIRFASHGCWDLAGVLRSGMASRLGEENTVSASLKSLVDGSPVEEATLLFQGFGLHV